MVKILIIEDEEAAAKRLQKMIIDLMPEAEIVNIVVSVISAVQWLSNNEKPDLILADIQLADGSSFEIFKRVTITSPVIFITAYDQFALHAFKLNSVHYLLKPIKKEELKEAIERFKKLHMASQAKPIDFEKLIFALQKSVGEYKQRFVIRFGEHLKTIETIDVAYFYTESKANFAVLKDTRRYPLDFNLDELEQQLNPKDFFRINRQFIISYHAIAEMNTYSKSRVLVKLNPSSKLETIVSTDRSAAFKLWLAGE